MSLSPFPIIILLLFTCKSDSRYTKNNILIIFIDDLRHLADETISLPNIKKIADEGVNFKNAFAQVSNNYIKFIILMLMNVKALNAVTNGVVIPSV